MTQQELHRSPSTGHDHGAVSRSTTVSSPAYQLLELIGGVWKSRAIATACELGIFDHLADGISDPGDLAAVTDTERAALVRLLRGLASLDLVVERPDAKFGLTRMGELLSARSPNSLRLVAELMDSPLQKAAWNDLTSCVRSGASYPRRAFDQDMFAYFRSRQDEAGLFNSAMTAFTDVLADEIPSLYAFGQAKVVADIGGGSGRLLAGILDAHPHLSGVLYDLPEVTAEAEALLGARGLSERVNIVGGDVTKSMQIVADVVLLKNVLHMFSDEVAEQVLTNVREVLPRGGHLLVIETLLPASTPSAAQSQMDLTMLLVTEDGRERNRQQFEALFDAAGFKLQQVKRTSTLNDLLVAVAL